MPTVLQKSKTTSPPAKKTKKKKKTSNKVVKKQTPNSKPGLPMRSPDSARGSAA